jgi:hypothetical protein
MGRQTGGIGRRRPMLHVKWYNADTGVMLAMMDVRWDRAAQAPAHLAVPANEIQEFLAALHNNEVPLDYPPYYAPRKPPDPVRLA